MARSFTSILILLLACAVSGKKATFVPRNAALTIPRGGAGPLDAKDTAQLATLLAGTHASLSMLSPSRILEVYDAPRSPLLENFALWDGEVVLAFSIAAWFLIVRESDLRTAVAAACIPWVVTCVKVLWNNEPKKLGSKAGPHWVNLAVGVAVLYACLANTSNVDIAIKGSAVYSLANGLLMALFPSTALNLWGVDDVSDENCKGFAEIGHFLTGSGVFQALNAFTDVDPIQAFGYAWIPALLLQVRNALGEGENKLANYVWMLVDAIVVVTCGIQKGKEHHDINSPL